MVRPVIDRVADELVPRRLDGHLTAGERAFTTSLGGLTYDLPAITAELAAVLDDLAEQTEEARASLPLVAPSERVN